MRVGLGFDSHRFDPSRPLILGGVRFPGHPGLSGHSDGDAVAHAVIDALLGAIASGNVGSHFPPEDETWKGADSMDLLRRSVRILEDAGFRPSNLDVVVITESPKIEPASGTMAEGLANALGISSTRISVKGKTNEKMGWIGAGEGLAVHAVALVTERESHTS